MTRRIIQVPVTFDAANRRKDRSLSIRLSTTQEIPNAEFAEIDKHVGHIGFFLFAENAFNDDDIPDEDAPSDTKSQAQRIRAVLFRSWKETTDESESFQEYYRRRTERYIRSIQEGLN